MAILKNAKGENIIFVMYDDSILDRHSERIRVAGIRLKNYRENSVALYMHDAWRRFPIGNWVNLRKVGSQLLGELDIDDEDEFAQDIGERIERGRLRAVSIGVKPLSRSDAPEEMLPGQRYKTIKDSEMLEGSIVPIGSSPVALPKNHKRKISRSLFSTDEGGSYNSLENVFSAGYENNEQRDFNNYNNQEKDSMSYDKIIKGLNLGLPEGATEDQVLLAMQVRLAYTYPSSGCSGGSSTRWQRHYPGKKFKKTS